MAHSQRSIRDHARARNQPQIAVESLGDEFEHLVSPALLSQMSHYRELGLRSRLLTLPVMVAAVLSLLWRDVPSVTELARMLARENLLWAKAINVSSAALAERFLVFPCELFEGVLKQLLPSLHQRWNERQNRPLPPGVAYAKRHFQQIWIADGSTLEALFRKLKSLEDVPLGQLAGKMCAVIDLATRLPVEVWFDKSPHAHDSTFGAALVAMLKPSTLLLLDRGFWDFSLFELIIEQQCAFITRLKANAKIAVLDTLSQSPEHKDQRIRLGSGSKGAPILELRLVQIKFGKSWYRYLCSELDPQRLPPFVVADLYARRWRIEETFLILKRLLGLSYLWTGSANGIKLQIWATWLFYSLLVDLVDQVAEAVSLPFERISTEMLYRSFYHFVQANARGDSRNWVEYVTAPDNADLCVVKSLRKKRTKPKLNLSPFPGKLLTIGLKP